MLYLQYRSSSEQPLKIDTSIPVLQVKKKKKKLHPKKFEQIIQVHIIGFLDGAKL